MGLLLLGMNALSARFKARSAGPAAPAEDEESSDRPAALAPTDNPADEPGPQPLVP